MKYFLGIIIYLFLIFYNIIYHYVPFGNYADELICLISIILSLLKILKTKPKIVKKSNNIKIITYSFILFTIGMISTVTNNYVYNNLIIIKDIMLTFKFPITYICLTYLLKNYHSTLLKKYLIKTSKILLIIIFIFGIISLFFNIGMGSSIRHGIRSYQFIYSHYTYLVFNTIVLLSAIMSENKKNYIYSFMGILTLIFTMRTKGFMFIAIYLIFLFLDKLKNIEIKKILKFRYMVPITIILLAIASFKIKQYMSWGFNYNLRNGLYLNGLKIAIDHFPFGSGFGTFATNISYNISPLYKIYNMLGYQGFSGNTTTPMSDVYWPSIYAQFGFIGLIIFIDILILIFKDIINNTNNSRIVNSCILILIYLIIASLAEASFSNETGVFSVVYICIFKCFYDHKGENK